MEDKWVLGEGGVATLLNDSTAYHATRETKII